MDNIGRNPHNSTTLSRMTYNTHRNCKNIPTTHTGFRGTVVPKYTSFIAQDDSTDTIPEAYKGSKRDKRDFW